MADIGWRPPPPTHFHASGRRFTHSSSGQSKNPLTAITVSTAILQPDRYKRSEGAVSRGEQRAEPAARIASVLKSAKRSRRRS